MIKRILWTLGLTLGLLVLARHPASATACVVPNAFTNGTVADATSVNANFSSLQSCGNNVDYRNIGAAGVYASQILPDTTAHATFGGAVGYVFNPAAALQVPLTILGASAQSGDLFDVCSTSCAAAKYVWVGSSGVLNTASQVATGVIQASSYIAAGSANSAGICIAGQLCGGVSGTSGTLVLGGGTSSATLDYGVSNGSLFTTSVGMVVPSLRDSGLTASGCVGTDASKNLISNTNCTNIPLPVSIANGGTGSATQNFVDLTNPQTKAGVLTLSATPIFGSGTAQFTVGHTIDFGVSTGASFTVSDPVKVVGGITATTTIQGSSNGSTVSYVPPGYAAGGTALASTFHIVQGFSDFIGSPATCAADTLVCGVSSGNVATFSGAAAFTSSTSYSCTATGSSGLPISTTQAAGSVTFSLGNPFSVGINVANTRIYWICVGT